ncbi:MAG: hypothetical protein GY863_02540, partial [bacterium]|nr:hypothetical protein [bacterium]
SDRTDDGWGEPYNPGSPVNTGGQDYFPSVTNDGTLYFTRTGADRVPNIYRSRLVDGKYAEPERLTDKINRAPGPYNAYIFPDESCLIYCMYGSPDSYGRADYYVAFRNDNDEWTDPVNAGPIMNSEANAVSASLSPDGKYLFFVSSEFKIPDNFSAGKILIRDLLNFNNSAYNGSSGVMWIKADFINELRK